MHAFTVHSQILAVDAVDADRKHREGRTCPDSLVVVGTKREFADLVGGTKRRFLRQSCPGLLACDSDDIYCRMQEDSTRFEEMLASYGAISIA